MTAMDGARPGIRGTLTIALVVVAATIGLVVANARGGGGTTPPQRAPGLRADLLPGDLDGKSAPDIRLADARGGTLDSATLRGRPYLVTFVYTRCPDFCPIIGSEIADALHELGPQAPRVTVLAVSVDPRHDTPAAATRWLHERGLGPEAHYLLGSRKQLTPVWQDWFVVAPGDTLADPTQHAAGVWLVDAAGRLRGRWSGGESIPPGDIAHDLRMLLGTRSA
jgi:protein SCO1/2